MRRILLIAIAVLFCATSTFAQTIKVDVDGVKKNIERSNTQIEHPKRGVNPNTWVERGNVFLKATTEPTAGLYSGLVKEQLVLMYGKPQSSEVKNINDANVDVYEYEYFTAYVLDGALLAWKEKTEIVPNAPKTAFESFSKAYELDNRSKEKVALGIQGLSNYYKQTGQCSFDLRDFVSAADAFMSAYEVQLHPSVNYVDTASVFNAGFLYTLSHEMEKGVKALREAEKYNYYNDGDLYFYMFHCYYGMKDLKSAKEVLFEGIGKFPSNTQLVEGLLAIFEETNDDPNDIILIVRKSIEEEPENIELWGGLGRIYDKLGQSDKAVEAFEKAVEISPNDFNANFNLGFLYIKKGDDLNKELNEKTPTNRKEFNDALAKVNGVYEKALNPLEKAHKVDPTRVGAIELLKNVTFRLRDESDEMLKKFEKYDALFKSMSAE